MTKQNDAPGGGWLPVLDAGQRFRPQTPAAGAIGHEQLTATSPTDPDADEPGETMQMGDKTTARPLTAIDWSAELENQFGITSAPSPKHETTSVAAMTDEDTIAELRDRLAYYEHFDSLIRDNISRSADLFQAVFAEREKVRGERRIVESDVISMSAEIERRMDAERTRTQQILLSLMDEATYLQQRADSLIQRIAEAITEASAQPDEDDEPVSGA